MEIVSSHTAHEHESPVGFGRKFGACCQGMLGLELFAKLMALRTKPLKAIHREQGSRKQPSKKFGLVLGPLRK